MHVINRIQKSTFDYSSATGDTDASSTEDGVKRLKIVA